MSFPSPNTYFLKHGPLKGRKISTASCKAARDQATLAKLQIDHIIGIGRTKEKVEQMKKEKLPCKRETILLAEKSMWGYSPFFKVLDAACKHKNLLVHCSAGLTRSPITTQCVLKALGYPIGAEAETRIARYIDNGRIPPDINAKLTARAQSKFQEVRKATKC